MRWLRRSSPPERIAMPQSTPVPEDGFLVGGTVRDALLGVPSHDLDWLVARPEQEARRAAAAFRAAGTAASAFALDEARGHWRVAAASVTCDYAPMPDVLEDDLRRRDFTVDAIAARLDGRLVDPLGGREDLRTRRLRMTSEASLAADPLRPLRGVRLCATLGLELEPATREAIRALALEQLDGKRPMAAWERIRDELGRMVSDPRGASGLLLADELGLLDGVLPELAACRHVAQGGFHHLDVLRHSLEALQRLAQGFPDADAALRWATLLHDVGKPLSKARGEDGRMHFYGHARLGQALAQSALARLRLPQAEVRRAGELVRYHMLPLPRNEREARRFVHRRGALLPDLLELMIADREAARGPLASEANRDAYRLALGQVLAILAEEPSPAPLIDGTAVMRLLGIGPGPHVGEALRLVREAEAVGDVVTTEEAEALLRHYAEAQGWRRQPPGQRP